MLLKLVDDLKPDYIVAARDLPGKTQRHELFEAYKATRVKAEPELVAQLEKSPKVFEAFGIPLYEAIGYEADDVVGTIVREVSGRSDLDVVIASGDLDTLQLVDNKHVQVYTLRKGLSDIILYDDEAVLTRFGFGPKHVVDYKALRGDPSDNIPGIKGIGEKGATELIQKFGSIEELYRAIEAMCDEFEFRALKERVRGASEKTSPRTSAAEESGQEVEPQALAETAIALWLLHSDTTNPSLEDILNYVNTQD